MSAERVAILGVETSAINMDDAVATVADWIERRHPNYVCVVPAHSVMAAREDDELREIMNRSGMTTPDGVAIVWLLKLRGYRQVERVYGPDLMRALCGASVERGWRHFFYGGAEGVADELAAALTADSKGLDVVGTYTPPFRPLTPDEDADVVSRIQESGADIVWVGIGSPRQERWMADHVGRVGAPVLIGVGAAFDFLSGRKPQAPRWMQRSGLEWLFRFGTEPRRLWPRYSRYPLFALLALIEVVRSRRRA